MFGSLFGVASDLVKVATAPVAIATEATRAVTKPVAKEAEALVKEVRNTLR